MTPELTALTLAALLQVVQFIVFAIPANRDLSPGYTLSPRDRDSSRAMSERTGRLQRAFANHFESLALFTIAVLVITLSDQSTPYTATLAWAYLIARILYVPAYVYGLVPWRSLIWAVGFFSATLMLIAALF